MCVWCCYRGSATVRVQSVHLVNDNHQICISIRHLQRLECTDEYSTCQEHQPFDQAGQLESKTRPIVPKFTIAIDYYSAQMLHHPMEDRKLSWPAWLVTYRDALPARRQSSIQVLTRAGVEQRHCRQTTNQSNCCYLEKKKRTWMRRNKKRWYF